MFLGLGEGLGGMLAIFSRKPEYTSKKEKLSLKKLTSSFAKFIYVISIAKTTNHRWERSAAFYL
jgi:hypothetical protein